MGFQIQIWPILRVFLVDFGKVLCSSANELQQNSNASSREDYIPQILAVLFEILPGGGVLPYITYTGMCRPTGSWFWSSWFRTGYPFQRRFLERGIIFRRHESSSFVSNHLKLFKDRLLLKIRFSALTSKLLYSLHPTTEYKKLAHF